MNATEYPPQFDLVDGQQDLMLEADLAGYDPVAEAERLLHGATPDAPQSHSEVPAFQPMRLNPDFVALFLRFRPNSESSKMLASAMIAEAVTSHVVNNADYYMWAAAQHQQQIEQLRLADEKRRERESKNKKRNRLDLAA
jgi:hypothetical protein